MTAVVASLKAVLELDDSQFNKNLEAAKTSATSFGSTLSSTGKNLQSMGAKMTLATLPIAAGLAGAVMSAVKFDSAITNIGAVQGKTRKEMAGLRAELLKVGGNAVAGPQAVGDAFYDIVGGVSDASTHMDILNAAIATSEAGQADLGGTTKALISVMNSYGFGAKDASYASDVLTRTVAMGVGTMDEFGSALPQVTGLANSLGISFGDLAGMTAYLSTQGNTASQSTTQLSAMMTSMLNPNEKMKAALGELGFASGQAAIDQLGLVGAFEAVAGTATAGEEGMAALAGSTEALRGITALGTEAFNEFTTKFTTGIDGATASARAIQLSDPAAQFELLKSKVSAVGIEAGSVLIPILLDLVNKITPVIDSVMQWAGEHPELMQALVLLGGALVIAGPLVTAIGTAMTIAGGAATLMSAPMMAAIAPILAVGAAVLGVIAAINHFNSVTGEARAAAGTAISNFQAAGGTTNKADLEARMWQAAVAESNSSHIDARILYEAARSNALADPVMGPILNGRAGGGGMSGNTPYMVGERGPEIFMPQGAGSMVPNHQMGGGGVNIDNVTINANTREGGMAAADGFKERLDELMAASGMVAA